MKSIVWVMSIVLVLACIVFGLLAALPILRVGLGAIDQANASIAKGNMHTAELEKQAVELGYTLEEDK